MIYPDKESRHLEFKSDLPSFLQLIKTCIAFANGVGGKIIIGIDDKTRKIIGIKEATRSKLHNDFPNSLYDSTEPGIIAEIYEKNYGSENIIIIDIPQSFKKPVYLKKDGINNGVYLRAGSSTRKANVDHIEEMQRDNRKIYFDETMVRENITVLAKESLRFVYPNESYTKLETENIIVKRHNISNEYYPTVTGILWFCDQPDAYIREAHIRCTRFDGIDGREIIQSEEIGGSLKNQIETSYRLIKSWIQKGFKLQETKLVGLMKIPEEALREAIVNAIIHRKYSIPGAIKIALYDNRLEIFSPGTFPGLVDINNLGDGTTYLRNPNIAMVARRMGYIERLGTGINLIFSSCKKAGLKAPEFIEGADSVKVIFNFVPDQTNQDNLLDLFFMRDTLQLSIKEIMSLCKVSRNTASRKLNNLVLAGKLQRIGKGPSVRYIINKDSD